MTWFRLDDGFWSHPKTSMLSDSAVALWVRAGSYCSQHLTDGVVPKTALRLLGKPSAAKELVGVGLWDVVDGGWSFHDWHEYQETSAVVKERREAARDRQRKAREAKAERTAKSQRESRVTDDVTDGVTSQEVRSPHATAAARGSRPDPTRPIKESSSPTSVRNSPPRSGGLERREANIVALNATARSGPANQITTAYSQWLGQPLDNQTFIDTAREIDKLLAADIDPNQIAAGIKAWHASNSWSPTQIRHYVAKAAKPQAAEGVSTPSRKAATHLSVAEQIIAEMSAT